MLNLLVSSDLAAPAGFVVDIGYTSTIHIVVVVELGFVTVVVVVIMVEPLMAIVDCNSSSSSSSNLSTYIILIRKWHAQYVRMS